MTWGNITIFGSGKTRAKPENCSGEKANGSSDITSIRR